jgi:hypothetical protein
MSVRFECGESPIWEYDKDVLQHREDQYVCNPAVCPACLDQKRAQSDGRARRVGTMTWSGTSQHSTLRRSFLDWMLGRPGKWVPD